MEPMHTRGAVRWGVLSQLAGRCCSKVGYVDHAPTGRHQLAPLEQGGAARHLLAQLVEGAAKVRRAVDLRAPARSVTTPRARRGGLRWADCGSRLDCDSHRSRRKVE